MLYQGNKSKLVTPLTENNGDPPPIPINGGNGCVVDLSVLIQAIASKFFAQDSTFREFIDCVCKQVLSLGVKYSAKRIDAVADFYSPLSIKQPTRINRGCQSAPRLIFTINSTLPTDLQGFLKNADNKTGLNELIVEQLLLTESSSWDGEIVVTYNQIVKTKTDGPRGMFTWIEDTHEEADNRMLVHIQDMLKDGISNIVVRSNDTDVFIILLSFLPIFNDMCENCKIWLDYGMGQYRRLIFINDSLKNLGKKTCLGLLFFHAFSGCDSTSYTFEKSKVFLLTLWLTSPYKDDLDEAFQKLSCCPSLNDVQTSMNIIQRYVCKAFYPSEDLSLTDTRIALFKCSTADDLRKIPPSHDSLLQHVLRSAYTAGWVWGNTLTQQKPPPKELWGWILDIEKSLILFKWTSAFNSKPTVQATTTCKCRAKNLKCTKCLCGKAKVRCLRYCSCKLRCKEK